MIYLQQQVRQNIYKLKKRRNYLAYKNQIYTLIVLINGNELFEMLQYFKASLGIKTNCNHCYVITLFK